MNENLVRQGIKVSIKSFFNEKHKNEELAITSLELFLELGLLDDISMVARIIEEEQAFALLEKINLFDVKFVEALELKLRGI